MVNIEIKALINGHRPEGCPILYQPKYPCKGCPKAIDCTIKTDIISEERILTKLADKTLPGIIKANNVHLD